MPADAAARTKLESELAAKNAEYNRLAQEEQVKLAESQTLERYIEKGKTWVDSLQNQAATQMVLINKLQTRKQFLLGTGTGAAFRHHLVIGAVEEHHAATTPFHGGIAQLAVEPEYLVRGRVRVTEVRGTVRDQNDPVYPVLDELSSGNLIREYDCLLKIGSTF